MKVRTWILAGLVLLFIPAAAAADESVPTDELREKFFAKLNKRQIVDFMKSIDKSKQLTSYELGAKYRWGYIPPDRTPPASLAKWWKDLSPRMRNEKRYQWFKNHYGQLSPDRVARQLGLQEKLTSIYRELRADYSTSPETLESVPFPSEQVEPLEANRGATEFEAIYEQENPPEANREEALDQRPEYLPEGEPPEARDVTSEDRQATDGSSTTPDQDQSTSTTGNDEVESEAASSNDGESATKSKPEEFASGDLIYRRVGDHIEVIGRTESFDTAGESLPAPESVTDKNTTNDEPSDDGLPRVKDRSGEVIIPPPVLRNRVRPGPPVRNPGLRRSP